MTDEIKRSREEEYDKKLRQQTSEETAGIPTPPDQEDLAATDGISTIVEAVMDKIEDALFPEEEDTR